jgi:hypothetical protein
MEVAVIQRLARHLVATLLARDPLSEKVHLSKPQMASIGLRGVASGAWQRIARALFPLAKSYRA